MGIDVEREAPDPAATSMQIVEDCATALAPEGDNLSAWHRSYVTNHKVRIAFDLDIVRNHVRSHSSVLEVGSIPLLMTTALSRLDYVVTGCDIAPERYAATIRSTGIDVVKCDIEAAPLPFPDDTYDAVVFNELFEHLRINPIFTLSQVLRVMKPGATSMLSTPNLRSLGGIRNFLLENRAFSCSGNTFAGYQRLETLGHIGDVREYTTTEVIEFLARIGLEVKKLIFRGDYEGAFERLITRSVPRLRPFVSYGETKPRSAS